MKEHLFSKSADRRWVAILSVYVCTLILYFAMSLMPDGRVWGLNWWGYYPSWVAGVLFAAGLTVGVLVRMIAGGSFLSRQEEPAHENPKTWWMFSIGVVLAGVISFVLLRGQTHFLGDGYGLLTMLGNDMASYHQIREYGESLAHLLVRDAIGTSGEEGALVAYQVLSVFSGVVFLTTVALVSRHLLESVAARVLFVLSMATGGYMLMFFGYVENYSLLLSSVTVYCLLGLLIARGKLARWWILFSLALCMFFHVMGVVLIPSAVFLLLGRSKLQARIRSLRTTIKWIIVFGSLAIAAAAFYFFSAVSYFFRFAIVPIVSDRFTVEGYTMFSLKHIADYLNLLVVVFPGAMVALVGVAYSRRREVFGRSEFWFLLIMTASAWAAAFIFDPKLGMPRDWDLFAFAGVPLIALTMFTLLADGLRTKGSMAVVGLAISLNLLVLGPRVVSQVKPDVAHAHFQNYITLDQTKNRYVSLILENYYLVRGDTYRAGKVAKIWDERYPEIEMVTRSINLNEAGKTKEAIVVLKEILNRDPFLFATYCNLATCYLHLQQFDSAFVQLQIALGLSPYNAGVWSNFGWVYLNRTEYDKAEHAWLKSLRYDSTNIEPILGLTTLYRESGQSQKYFQRLTEASTRPNAPSWVYLSLGDCLLDRGDSSGAISAWKEAGRRGTSERIVEQRIRRLQELSR